MTIASPININLPKSKRWVRLTMTVIPFIALIGYSLLSLHWQEHNEFVIYPLFAFSGQNLRFSRKQWDIATP